MEWLKSAASFLCGFIWRAFLGLILLFDDSRAPSQWPLVGERLPQAMLDWVMPDWAAVTVMVLVFSWAGIQTYHKERLARLRAEDDRALQERVVRVRQGFRELEGRARVIVAGFEKKQQEARTQAAGDDSVYADQIKNVDPALANQWRADFIEYIRDQLGATQAMPYEQWGWFESSEPVGGKEALGYMWPFIGAANDKASSITILDLPTQSGPHK